LGQGKVKVFFTHILPHLYPYLREQGLSLFLSAVLMEASLSYLGAGLNPGTPSLGAIISEAKDYMLSNPLFLAFPSIALIAISVALALIIRAFSELDSSSK
jgi:peptide/nickel transport system permease protein